MPNNLNPIAIILTFGLLLSVGAVSHTGRYLSDKAHRVAHMSIKPQPPRGWQVAIERDGKITYFKERRHTFATQRQYLKMMAGK